MKYSYLLLIVGPSLLAIACAQGEDGNNKNAAGAGGGGGQIIGGTGGTNTGTGGSVSESCAASGYTDATCGACMEANCAGVCQACLNDTNCANWLDCAMGCTDSTCEDGCTQQYPAGEAPGLAWLGNSGCIGTSCGSQCGTSSGGCGLTTSDATCDACITSYCCTQGNTCANDQGCLDVLDCIKGCATGDTACEDSCMNSNPTGASELNDFGACLNQMCANDCTG